jgi:hypothetical protein
VALEGLVALPQALALDKVGGDFLLMEMVEMVLL